MVLTQIKVSFKRFKRQLGYPVKGSDDLPEHDVHNAPDACSSMPLQAKHAPAQPSPKLQHLQQGHAPGARHSHDQAAACQPSLLLKHANKGQRDCDVFLAIPGSGSDSTTSQHRLDCTCSDCAAQHHPCRRKSLQSPCGLASVAESEPILIAAGAGGDRSRPGCCPRLGACYSSSSGSSSTSESVGDEHSAGGSPVSLSRGSSCGNMAGSSEEWNAEAMALQAACDAALRVCNTPQNAIPTCGAAHSPLRAAVQQQQQHNEEEQRQAAKAVAASPLGGFFRGLLGRTRSAPMADASSLSTDVSGTSSDKSPHDSSSTHMQAGSSSLNTASQQQVLISALSMPDCGIHGPALLDRITTWGLRSAPASDCQHRQQDQQKQQQQQQQQQRRRQQQHREQQQSPFSVAACSTRSSAPLMVAVEPLQAPAATRLLAVSEQLPRRMARSCWCLADFSVVRKMYKGNASSVYHATDRQSGMSVALKVYHMERLGPLNHHQVYREVRLHAGLAHENIICLYAAFQEGQDVVMVQEYAAGGDLYCVLHRSGGRLSERQAVELVLQPFLLALHYMHTRGILHRDIKPENVLFTCDSILKVADFGLAIDLTEEYAVTRAGTLDYMAPEVLRCPAKELPEDNKAIRRLQYTNSVDAWAVGVFAYELVVGFPPFASNCATDSMERIMSGPSAVVFPKRMSEAARSFISDALQMHPGDRPTVREMLMQPWVAQHSRRRSMRVAEPLSVDQVLASHTSITGSYPLSPGADPRAPPLSCPLPQHSSRSARRRGACRASSMNPLLLANTPREHGRPAARTARAKAAAHQPAVTERCGASPPPLLQLPVACNATMCALLHESAEALQRWDLACRRASLPPLYPAQAMAAAAAGVSTGAGDAQWALAAQRQHTLQVQQAGS